MFSSGLFLSYCPNKFLKALAKARNISVGADIVTGADYKPIFLMILF
jgi:hypothetical protein